METRKNIGISLSKKIIRKIDKDRGLVSRSRFIEELILKAMGGNSK